MVAAKKKVVRKKAATPPKTPSNPCDDFLNPSQVSKKKTKGKGLKVFKNLPGKIGLKLDDWANAKKVIKAAERKSSDAESEVLNFLLDDFAAKWAESGSRPVSSSWKGATSSFDYIVTKAITFTADKKEAAEQLGVDLTGQFNIASIVIDYQKINTKKKHQTALKNFLKALGDDMDDVIEKKFKLNDNFFDSLGKVCDNDKDKVLGVLKILKPRVSPKNFDVKESEEDSFEFVQKMKG